ncbi:hypothetical protein [Mycolicibacterium sp. 120270]|uniref:hypothetical protein n=1 Tax=Mycolicibacterium sp. 120270 TaxID=3090600 RepID=UPI00299D91A5|nr:hypothetical protein [Mycolicibacterium sp. 120270]MDX1886828.1 hypothetical protein [Mycolicibacterium sp. 120270]
MAELWTTDQAARYWGVTPARARGILSARHIHRIAGYPAEDIWAVDRHQGARTDLTTPTAALTLATTAAALTDTADDRTRWRLFLEFNRGADEAGRAALTLIRDEPPTTGQPRYDALLAAIAEHIAARYALPGPLWSITTDRFLDTPWWTSDLPSARAYAMLSSPAAFRRRGIYLDRHDLTHDGATPMPEPLFDRAEIHRALTALAAELQRRGVIGHVHVIGGAAMLLAYDETRVATRDIDALFSPDGPMVDAIRKVATDNGWPSTWLNSQAASYVSRTPGTGSLVFDHPYLQVAATPPRHLLAMKVLAARPTTDRQDLEFLLDYLNITSEIEVWAIVQRYFPDSPIPERSRLLIADLLR